MYITNCTWNGPEEPLGTDYVTATYMSILKIEDNDRTLTAEGRFTLYDHLEGCEGDDPWVATGTFEGSQFTWTVRRKDPTASDFCFCSNDGEPLFCLCTTVNAAIKLFIATKLTLAVLHIRKNPARNEADGKPATYIGPIPI